MRKSSLSLSFVSACLVLIVAAGLSPHDAAAQTGGNGERCSPRTQGGVEATFINNSSQPVTFHWMDFDCIEGEGSSLPPGQQGKGLTYPGHVFIARGQGGQLLNIFKVSGDAPSFVVDDRLIAKVAEQGEPYTEGHCSPKTDGRFTVEFVNLLNEPVAMHWIGFDCEVHVLRKIPAHGKTQESTFPGHIFRFVDSVGGQLGSFEVTPDERRYLISAG